MCRSSAAERTRSSIAAFFSFCMLEPEGDVVVHLHVREDRVALEHHRDASSSRREIGGIAVADVDAPVVDALESRETAQERRLPAARRPEQDHELAVAHLEVDAVHRGEAAEVLAHPLEADLSHARPFRPHRATRPQVLTRYLRMKKMTRSAGASRKKPPARRYGSGDVSSAASI